MPESDRWTLLGMVVPKTDMNRRWDGFQVPKTKYSNLFQSTKRLHKNSGDTKIIQNHYQFSSDKRWPRPALTTCPLEMSSCNVFKSPGTRCITRHRPEEVDRNITGKWWTNDENRYGNMIDKFWNLSESCWRRKQSANSNTLVDKVDRVWSSHPAPKVLWVSLKSKGQLVEQNRWGYAEVDDVQVQKLDTKFAIHCLCYV